MTKILGTLQKGLTLSLLLGATVLPVFAQSGTSTISGAVRDPQDAAVSGATVTIVNNQTGLTRSVNANESGVFSFAAVPPGNYNLTVEAAGFKKYARSEIVASVDLTTEITAQLEIGSVNETITVTSTDAEQLINTQDATVGNNFKPQQITQLPTDLRQINNLLSLQPGVTREGYVNGGRSDQANITLDGVDVNDQQTGSAFSSVLRLTAESIEEFRLTTTNPNANQGRSSGAQISLVTKSGTNDFRGAAFYFLRPTTGSANEFFNNAAGIERPQLTRHVYGGALGGPIKRDKLFFFYSFEGQRERTAIPTARVVPLASLGRGELRFDAPGGVTTLTLAQLNSIYSQAGINPVSLAILADAARRYPANDLTPGIGDGLNTGGFRFNNPFTQDQNTHILKLDYNINSNQSAFARFNYQYDLTESDRQFPDTLPIRTWEHPLGFVVGHNWTIGSNKVNNFRYGFTRQAFSIQGDSNMNDISFRFIYSPITGRNDLSRITPVQNITDDFTYIAGNHTLQFGGNIRIIRNRRTDTGRSYDSATTNPLFYASSGRVLDRAVSNAGYNVPESSRSVIQNAAAALIGRFTQYTGNFNYDLNGNILPVGTPIEREFATEEYDVYAQDSWKARRDLTLTFGLRYGLSRPVYEKNGYQVAPTERLSDFFERRRAGAEAGRPVNDLLNFQLAGPTYNKAGFYSLDKNNFQPRFAFAYSPSFKRGFLNTIFGENKSVLRGGFSIVNDYFGQQLAVTFDQLSSLGFTTSDTIAANTYNLTTNLAPRLTGFGQSVRNLPNISAPNRFQTPADEDQRIESSLDSALVSPTHYQWSASFGRELPKGLYFEASYIGRRAKNLLATRDIMALNNLKDTRSGMDWYTAAGLLADLRDRNVPISAVPNIPYFQNLFPGLGGAYSGDATLTPTQEVYALIAREGVGGLNILDWTYVQLLIDDDPNAATPAQRLWSNYFYHPQYAAFSAFSTVANSNYHGGSFTLRQRFGEILSYDINYTLSKSMDDASGLQTSSTFGNSFILNPLRQSDNYSVSDFDTRHVVNANFIFQVPIGRDRRYFNSMNRYADAVLGGWQLAGIFRWNSGTPFSSPFEAAQWATNWNVQSNGIRLRPVDIRVNRQTQNIFSNPQEAYKSFRNARAGETGDRNVFYGPNYSVMDVGLSKNFSMPWGENHKLQFRVEAFNVTNVQYFQISNYTRTSYALDVDPQLGTAPSEFGKIFNQIQGTPRRLQFGLRYSF